MTISEEVIRADDLGEITGFIDLIAEAGIRTLKQYITEFFVNNPNYGPDGVAWFHASHNNSGSAALSPVELDARQLTLRKQTQKDSGKRLSLLLEWIMVPVDLEATAKQINRNQTSTNSWFQKFGPNDENIIVNELLADTNDWYYGTLNAPSLEIGFLDGLDVPRITIANEKGLGMYFSNDQIIYKGRFVFGGNITDFRGVGKNVV